GTIASETSESLSSPGHSRVAGVEPVREPDRPLDAPPREPVPRLLGPEPLPPYDPEWPSARAILDACRARERISPTPPRAGRPSKPRARAGPKASTKRRVVAAGASAMPTEARLPEHRSIPLWLAGPPAVAAVLVLG